MNTSTAITIWDTRLCRGLSCSWLRSLGEPTSWPCLALAPPTWKTAPRDRFIGWCPSERERNLQLIVNNARFLILPWVQSQNLASKLLALAARLLPQDWHDRYAYRPVLLETFVDTQRFTGTCYKAANWIPVGQTQGRGKLDRFFHKADLPTKSISALPPEQILPNP